MTCGDVHYSADKCLKRSVSEAICVIVWACEALLDLWGMIRWIVVPKVDPSGWWVTAASADGFTKPKNTIFNPYLATGFGDHSTLVFLRHLSCGLRVPVFYVFTSGNLSCEGQWTEGAFSPCFQE